MRIKVYFLHGSPIYSVRALYTRHNNHCRQAVIAVVTVAVVVVVCLMGARCPLLMKGETDRN